MPKARLIEPSEAHDHAREGALIVCAYDDVQRCRDVHVAGAMPLPELKRRESDVEPERELIFY